MRAGRSYRPLEWGFRVVLWLIGLGFIGWAVVDPRFRDIEGFPTAWACLPVSAGVAALILGSFLTGRFRRPARWFALALVGNAITLQMIEAGPYVRYQHYRDLSALLSEGWVWLLAGWLLQGILVGIGLVRHGRRLIEWLWHNLGPWRLLGVALVFVLPSVALSPQITRYIAELGFALGVQLIHLGNIVLFAVTFPADALRSFRQRIGAWLGFVADPEGSSQVRLGRFVWVAALWAVCLTGALSLGIYQNHPHVPDEVMYLYQARYLAEGQWTVPAPSVPEAFTIYMVPYQSSEWYSIFPPGWPAVLALGVLLGTPWLVNPLLAGLNVVLVYLFVRRLYDSRIARLTVVLLCVSPWYLFMAMSFMSHTLTLTFALVAGLAFLKARSTGGWVWGLIAGMGTGALSLVRPMDGLIVAVLLGVWALGLGGRRLRWASIALFVVGTLAIGGLIFPYNQRLMGDPLQSPLMSYYEEYYGPKTNALGFGPERGLGWALDAFPGHSPLEAALNALLNFFAINVELLGWGTGSLLIIGLLLFSGRMQHTDRLLIVAVVLVVGVYSLYWFHGGPDFGARYWYLALLPLVILVARGTHALQRLNAEFKGHHGARVGVAVLALCCIALLNFFPWRTLDKYHHYRGMRPDIRRLAQEHDFGRSLILIRGDVRSDYESAWIYNPLEPNAAVPIYAWDRDADVQKQLYERYADRPVWIIDGPSLTRRGFEVVEGPFPVHERITTIRSH